MRRLVVVASIVLSMVATCADATGLPSDASDLSAFRDFGFEFGMVWSHYVTPIDSRKLLTLALLGIEHETSPAQDTAQPIVQAAISDIQSMPPDYAQYPAATSNSVAERSNINTQVSIFGNTVAKVSALPGAPSKQQLLQTATVSMIDGIDSVTHYMPGSSVGEPPVTRPAPQWCLIGNIFYIHVFAFVPSTPFAIEQMYAEAQQRAGGKLDGVILDLRSNSGGFLYMTADVAGLFLPKGAPVATVVNRTPQANETLKATTNDMTNGLRMVVVINRQTSNGAEIVADSLKFNHRAVLVGTTTAGSGYVGTIIPMPESGHLFLVTGQTILPSGQPLQSNGIIPDVSVEQTTEGATTTADPTGFSLNVRALQQDESILKAMQILQNNE